MDDASQFIFDFVRSTPLVGALVLLMCADVLSGIMVAISKRQLNSTVSLKGMTKKGYMLLVVGAAAVMEPHADDIPLAKLVSGFFCWSELVSIIENGVALGVPVPKAFKETLAKFRDEEETEIRIAEQTIPARVKRKSDVVLLEHPPPKQAGDADGCSQPRPPS